MKVVLIRLSLIAFFGLPSSNFFIHLVYTYTYTSTQLTNWLIFLHLFTVSYSLINQLSVQQLDLVAKNSLTHLVVCCNCDSVVPTRPLRTAIGMCTEHLTFGNVSLNDESEPKVKFLDFTDRTLKGKFDTEHNLRCSAATSKGLGSIFYIVQVDMTAGSTARSMSSCFSVRMRMVDFTICCSYSHLSVGHLWKNWLTFSTSPLSISCKSF